MKKLFANLIITFVLCAFSLSAQNFVIDRAEILQSSEVNELEAQCASLSEQYNCGVYIVTVQDFQTDGYYSFIEEYAYDFYMYKDFGIGSDKNGIMLILSMADRDFDIMAYGDFGNMAFTDYGKEALEKSFLNEFHYDRWKMGFSKYLKKTAYLLKWAEKGKSYDVNSLAVRAEALPKAFILALIVSLIIAQIRTKAKQRGLNNIYKASTAGSYLISENVSISSKLDNFIRTTETRTPITPPSKSGGGSSHGGTTIGSNGSSHRSGKF